EAAYCYVLDLITICLYYSDRHCHISKPVPCRYHWHHASFADLPVSASGSWNELLQDRATHSLNPGGADRALPRWHLGSLDLGCRTSPELRPLGLPYLVGGDPSALAGAV